MSVTICDKLGKTMLVLGVSRGLAVAGLLVLCGCSTSAPDEAPAASIRMLSTAAARQCRQVGPVNVTTPANQQYDDMRDTMALAKQTAAAMGGNALLVDSMLSTTLPGNAAAHSYKITGRAYSCS